ncbi:MAG: metal ABC transporter ATP-binding protein [Chloroflexota bacterium]|nr:metal ABC transporter ATP-binding protein [Chloroflexota bacterium]
MINPGSIVGELRSPIVELDRISYGYTSGPVLHDISLRIQPGQFKTLVGPSGAGKTTLLKLVLGLLRPTGGEVRYGGQSERAGRVRTAYVPQLEKVDWNFPVTVEQVVHMGNIRRSGPWPWPSREERRRAIDVLQDLEIAHLRKEHIRNLSGGQQQRVFLARALVASPDLLVLDEPTAGVDISTAENVLYLLTRLNRRGLSILMTTHDLNLAAFHSPTVICLNRRLIAEGSPEAILNEDILSETYGAPMLVLRQNSMLFVHPKPHSHPLDALVREGVQPPFAASVRGSHP